LSLQSVASPSLLNHGRVGLDRIRGNARALAKPHKSGVHDRVPEDLASPVQEGGYVMTCVVFDEQGFGVSAH
jgi:hypothetical protein